MPTSTRVYDGFVKVDKVETSLGIREVVRVTDSVAMLVHNITRDELLLVEQVRVPMIGPENDDGSLLEVAAGRFDVDLPLKDLIRQELEEELGISDVGDNDIVILNHGKPLALSPGVLTERQYLAYVKVGTLQINPKKRRFGTAGEDIERHFVKLRQLDPATAFFGDMKTWALVTWFFREMKL